MVQPQFDISRARPVPREFYNRDPRRVARDILGKVLVRREGRKVRAGRIVEVEVYLGENDAAAHAFAGKTARNFVLFGPPGFAYVYFIYGNHYCLNVSCMPEGHAGSLLFRALQPLAGIDHMFRARNLPLPEGEPTQSQLRMLTSGPGRMAEAFDITRDRDNGKDLTAGSDLCIMDDGCRPKGIARTPRVGITKAAGEMLRYVIADNAFVSRKS